MRLQKSWLSSRLPLAIGTQRPVRRPRAFRWVLVVAPLLALSTVVALGSCASNTQNRYAQGYVTALDNQAGVIVQDVHFDGFLNFITHLGSADWEERFEGVYADDVHFSDTLVSLGDRPSLREYFAGLHSANTSATVNILSMQSNGQDGYLIWEMHSQFKPLLRTKQSHSIGMTHLRFNEDGEVILHQDFWDAATGFYEQIPVLGGMIRNVRARVQP